MSQQKYITKSSRHLLLAAFVVMLSSGCPHNGFPSLVPRSPEIPNESSVDEIVQVLNVNTLGTQTQQGLKSWNATNASVSVPGMVNVPATIAVEAPRNLRIRVAHPLTRSELVDMGSNPDEFWFWAKSPEPTGVVHVRHDEVDVISQYFDLPLHPDWMMEVFGVVPLNPTDYQREESDAGRHFVELVGRKTAPNGMLVRNMIRVDLRRGVIVRRSLHADDGTVLGIAEFSDHERDSQSQLMLPRQIRVEVPAMEAAVTIYLKSVQLNPPPMANRFWQPPTIAGESDVHMINWLPEEAIRSVPIQTIHRTGESTPYYPSVESDDVGSASLNSGRDAGASLQPYAWGGASTSGLPSETDSMPGVPMSHANDVGRVSIGRSADGNDAPLWGQNLPTATSPFEPNGVPFEPTPPSSIQAGPSAFEPSSPNQPPVWARE